MPNHTCCFTGHRPESLYKNADDGEVYNSIVKAVENAVSDGYTVFICGGSRGGDFLFADAVLYTKIRHPEIKLCIALACRDQASDWSREDRNEFSRLLDSADQIVCLSDRYTSGCMQKRNRYMVEQATLLIAAYNGTQGGTKYTYSYAAKKHLRIVNVLDIIIQESDQLSFL